MVDHISPRASPGPIRSSQTRRARKLRDSCTSCASSKVRCTKEKPACARCIERGLACQYMVSKRMGRNPRAPSPLEPTQRPSESLPSAGSEQGHSTHNTYSTPHAHTQADTHTRSNSHSHPQPQPQPQSDQPPNALPTPNGSSSVSAIVSHQSPRLPSETQGLGGDSSGQDQGTLSSLAVDSDFGDSLQSIDHGNNTDFLAEPTGSLFDAFLEVGTPMIDPFLESAPLPPFQARYCCFSLALQTLTHLFPHAPLGCQLQLTDGEDSSCNLTTIDMVISGNKQATDAVRKILGCSCAQDGYLLSIVVLIVLKVLGWYAAAAGTQCPSTAVGGNTSSGSSSSCGNSPATVSSNHLSEERVLHLPSMVGEHCVDEEDQPRVAAQLVLSELHRVQSLVNLLAKRLHEGGDDAAAIPAHHPASPFALLGFSGLEANLRHRLRVVSADIIDFLHRE
ncbi:aflatoxin biosynthesis regulatory protein [Aspergillus pseudocaelatus]|uniref:Aflatoxin biosynthesis regulatory protein n=1 Tax=Aspergillus pseudocaelatus TaxID=1825620 RepID=A0ABQ6X1Q3_9EURO|nr:aflatoxin biosynthesis regulatory protein [Aspergillus pseudocaelatus]